RSSSHDVPHGRGRPGSIRPWLGPCARNRHIRDPDCVNGSPFPAFVRVMLAAAGFVDPRTPQIHLRGVQATGCMAMRENCPSGHNCVTGKQHCYGAAIGLCGRPQYDAMIIERTPDVDDGTFVETRPYDGIYPAMDPRSDPFHEINHCKHRSFKWNCGGEYS